MKQHRLGSTPTSNIPFCYYDWGDCVVPDLDVRANNHSWLGVLGTGTQHPISLEIVYLDIHSWLRVFS
jgi:hypothetical protein